MLNKNGWGLRAYIIGCSILLLALLVATFLIIRLYSSFPDMGESIMDTIEYSDLEENLNKISLRYINSYYKKDIKTGVVTVSTDKLLDKQLIDKYDLKVNDDKCEGYSLIRKDVEDGIEKLKSESYITCKYYTTDGFQSWRIENE